MIPLSLKVKCHTSITIYCPHDAGLGSLISLEFDMIRNPSSTTCCHGEDFEQMTKILNLHFNSLDFIGRCHLLHIYSLQHYASFFACCLFVLMLPLFCDHWLKFLIVGILAVALIISF